MHETVAPVRTTEIVGFQTDWRQRHLPTGERGPDWALDSPAPAPACLCRKPRLVKMLPEPRLLAAFTFLLLTGAQSICGFLDRNTNETSSSFIRSNCHLLWEVPWLWGVMRSDDGYFCAGPRGSRARCPRGSLPYCACLSTSALLLPQALGL